MITSHRLEDDSGAELKLFSRFTPGTTPRMLANVLPPEATKMLVTAAHVEPHVAFGNSGERALKVNEAIQAVKRRWPRYFR